jgi:hypothetical protein
MTARIVNIEPPELIGPLQLVAACFLVGVGVMYLLLGIMVITRYCAAVVARY